MAARDAGGCHERGVGFSPGGFSIELRDEPGEAVEVVLQALFRVFAGVVENADRTVPAAVADDAEQLQVERALPEREDLAAELLAVAVHTVEIDGEEVRLHLLEQLREAVEVIVAVVKIVDDADVLHAVALEPLDDRELVLRLAEPLLVIVESDCEAERRRGVGDLADALRFRLDPLRLFLG